MMRDDIERNHGHDVQISEPYISSARLTSARKLLVIDIIFVSIWCPRVGRRENPLENPMCEGQSVVSEQIHQGSIPKI